MIKISTYGLWTLAIDNSKQQKPSNVITENGSEHWKTFDDSDSDSE